MRYFDYSQHKTTPSHHTHQCYVRSLCNADLCIQWSTSSGNTATILRTQVSSRINTSTHLYSLANYSWRLPHQTLSKSATRTVWWSKREVKRSLTHYYCDKSSVERTSVLLVIRPGIHTRCRLDDVVDVFEGVIKVEWIVFYSFKVPLVMSATYRPTQEPARSDITAKKKYAFPTEAADSFEPLFEVLWWAGAGCKS